MSYGIPLEGVEIGGCGASLEDSLSEYVVPAGRGRSAGAERGQAVCIIVNICCSRAVHRFLRDVAVIIVRESGCNNFFLTRCSSFHDRELARADLSPRPVTLIP